MTNETKVLGIIFGVTIVVLVGAVLLLSKPLDSVTSPFSSEKVQSIDYSTGQKIGSESAKVKLVEYSDFQCPACQAAQPFVKEVVKNYGSEILFVYKHFPLPPTTHPFSYPAATVAEEAASQGKFWPMHDKLFETQQAWSAEKDPTEFFAKLAQDIGVNPEKVRSALKDNSYKSQIDKQLSEGFSLGVNSTPTFFLNGKKLNLADFSQLNSIVENEIKLQVK